MSWKICSNQAGVPAGKTRFEFTVHIDGIRHRRRVTCQKSIVADWHRKWEQDLTRAHLNGEATLFDILSKYLEFSKATKSEKMYKHEASIINGLVKKYFNERTLLADIRRHHVEDFLLWRRKIVISGKKSEQARGKVSTATVNRSLSVLSYFFNWAIGREYYHAMNPCYRVKLRETNQREVRLTTDEIRTMLDMAREYDASLYDAVKFALYSGMRRGEMMNLTWSEVDLENSFIRLPQHRTKNRTAQAIPIVPTMREILLSLEKRRGESDRVFSEMTVETLRSRWERFRKTLPFGKLADGSPLRWHDLRHLTAQLLLNLGNDMVTVQHILRHKDISTTQRRYCQFARPDLLEKASLLETLKLH